MFRSNRFARVLGTLAVALATAIAFTTAGEAQDSMQDPLSEQRAAAAKRAPAGTAVPSDRYLAAAAHVAKMPSYSTADLSLDSTATVVGAWTNLGPSNVGGRTRALLVQSANTWYAGGVAGGVFKTTDAGLNWTSTGDAMANMAVSALVSKPGTPATVWAGTGEGFFNEDLVRGAGIFQSLNSGTTWAVLTSTSNSNFHYVNDLVWSTANPTNVYAATSVGVFRTINSGTTWTQILSPLINGGCLDLALIGGATDTLVASCGNQVQAKVYRTQGTTAVDIGSWAVTLQDGGMGRTSLASDPSIANVVYALSANLTTTGLHKVFLSTDGGATWTPKATSASPAPSGLILQNAKAKLCSTLDEAYGWYANTIAIDPSDVTGNTVWSGSYDLYRSVDGGTTWSPMSSWSEEGSAWHVPQGQHAIVFGAADMLVAGDKGILRMTTAPSGAGSFAACPGGGTVSTAVFAARNNGYAVTQFNSAAVAPSDTTYIGGTQHGTFLGTDAAGAAGWSRIWADYGGAAVIDPTDPMVIYLAGLQGKVRRSLDGGATFPNHPTFPGGYWIDGLSGNFTSQAPLAMDPTDPSRLWIAGDQVFRSDNQAGLWSAASAALASKATAIAVSPANPELVLVGTTDGKIYRNSAASSGSGSTVWLVATPRAGYVSSIAFDALNPSLAYATYATFGGVHLYKSSDGGAIWIDADGAGATGLPDAPVHSVIVDPTTATRIYAGTDVGVFVSLNSGTTWAKENTGFPNVITERLVASGANLYAFTHGRGAWRVPLTTGSPTTTVGFVDPRTTFTEQGVAVNVEVVLSTANHANLAGPVTVAYASAAGGALAGSDFTAVSGILTFPLGSPHGSIQTIAVPVVEDAIGEPTENFALNLSAPTGGALLALKTHTVSIEDDADPVGLSVSDMAVSEATASVIFTVSLYPAPTGTVTVNYATANGTADAGVAPAGDFTAASGVLTFLAGNTSKTVTVLIRADTLAEPAETFSLNLSGSVGAAIVDNQAVATIADNDVSGSLQFSLPTYTVLESGLNATITVTRTGGAASGVTVEYVTSNLSAVGPGDYTPTSGTLVFTAALASKTFTIPIFNDTLDEIDETLLITLQNPLGLGATLGAQTTATLSITDNDVAGALALSAATYVGTEGTSLLVTVKRTGGTASGVCVDYDTMDGIGPAPAATAPLDYTSTSGTLCFASGAVQATFLVPLVAESPILVDDGETFQIDLSNPQGGGTLGPINSATVTIGDASPRVAFQLVSTAPSEAVASVTITVLRTGPTTTAVTVPYFTTDGTATAVAVGGDPADYTAVSANLVIPVGITTKTFVVALKLDTVAEGPQAFTVNLGTPIGGILGTNTTITVNIADNDNGGVLVFSAANFNVNEPLSGVLPAKAIVTVKRTGTGLASGVTVPWSTSDGTAIAPADYTTASGTLTFGAGIASLTFMVDVFPDADVEGYDTINLTLGSPTGGATLGAPATATVTIIDSEPVVQFTPTLVTVGEGTPKATFTIKRTGTLVGALTVNIADLGGTATLGAGGDYNNVPSSVIMPTNLATKTFTVDVLQDSTLEIAETVTVGLASCIPGCTVGPLANAVLSIVDDEPSVSFNLAPYNVTEGVASATVTLKRTGSTALAITVGIADLLTGTATSGVDYGIVPTTVVIPAAIATKTFTIPIVNDLVGEPGVAETINLQIVSTSAGAYIGTPATATVNITDNEPTIAFALASYTVSEPLNTVLTPTKLTVAVKRTGVLTQVSTVSYAITAGTATAGVDYAPFTPAAASGTLTFASGVATINIVIDIIGDLVDDGPPNETILLALSSPTGAKLGTIVNATANIVDNDL